VAGWDVVPFLARGSTHTAEWSRASAAEPGISVRLPTTACTELIPVDGL
jgi:hypothetical protein